VLAGRALLKTDGWWAAVPLRCLGSRALSELLTTNLDCTPTYVRTIPSCFVSSVRLPEASLRMIFPNAQCPSCIPIRIGDCDSAISVLDLYKTSMVRSIVLVVVVCKTVYVPSERPEPLGFG
jgi:hypothetical protein